MTTTPKVLIPAKQAEAAQTTQYTSTNCKSILELFTVTNTSGTAALLSVNVVTVGDSAGASNLIVKELSVAPGETKVVTALCGQRLDAGDFISTIAGTASALTIRASGRQFTS